MADEKLIPISKIFVPADRLRPIDDTPALIIAASIKARGLLQAIIVRPTPRLGATPYTLVAGGRRLRAHQLLGLAEIRAEVWKIDAEEAQRAEVEENLFRDELTALQRAIFVKTFRELWEKDHGEIRRGNPALSNSANLAELGDDSAMDHFFQDALDRIGLSERGIRRAYFIAEKLVPGLQVALRGTPAEDNQALLIRLAKLEPEKQSKLVIALDITGGDLEKALETIDDAAAARDRRSVADKRIGTVFSNFKALGAAGRKEAVAQIARTYRRGAVELVETALSDDDQFAVYEALRTKFEALA